MKHYEEDSDATDMAPIPDTMTDKPRTFKELYEDYTKDGIDILCIMDPAIYFWHARDEEVAAKDRRIAELEAEVQRVHYGPGTQDEIAHLDGQIKSLLARIDAVRALAEKWRRIADSPEEDSGVWDECFNELLAALGEPAAETERNKQR